MSLKHIVLRNPRLIGWEYGMLRAFEEAIAQETGAEIIDVPDYGLHPVSKRMAHSTRWNAGRKLLPRKKFSVDADVVWYILMGPENYELDLFTGWDIKAKHRIVYIYDTLEPQFNLVQKLFSNDKFNIRITSFNDAVPVLEEMTRRKWYAVEQAVPQELFGPVSAESRVIPFSSYGRRLPVFHKAIQEFCQQNRLYYDFTTHNGQNPTATEEELYRQYAWHLNHSLFTISWPVELTNPARAGRLNPITCRWFEAAASGTMIIGQKPQNEKFEDYLTKDLVLEIDPFASKETIWHRLDTLYTNRLSLLLQAETIRKGNAERWTWNRRVHTILGLIGECSTREFNK